MWDRYKGDCLHVLEMPLSLAKIFSYVIARTGVSALLIWDIVSGKLGHKINYTWLWGARPIRGKEGTLETIERDENPSIFRFRIWDLRSGQLIRASSFEPGVLMLRRFFQDRFFIGIAKKDEGHILKVWDFGANYNSLNAEVGLGNDDRRCSMADIIDKTEGIGKNDYRNPVVQSSSSSIVEDTLPGASTMQGKGNRDKGKNFIHALFRRH